AWRADTLKFFEGRRAVGFSSAAVKDRRNPQGFNRRQPRRPTQMVPSDRILLDARSPATWETTLGLNLEQKQAVVAEVAKQVAGAQAIVMAQNRGMAVADMIVLRARARAS